MAKQRAVFRAGWRSRSETLNGGAIKILDMLSGFERCLPELREWSCEPPPFAPAPLTVAYISQRLERSAKRLKRQELGFGFAAWSGTKERAFGLNLNIGSTSRVIPDNRINLKFPLDITPDQITIKCLLSTFVRIWQPEFAAYNPVYPKKERRFELGEIAFLTASTENYLSNISVQDVKREPFERGHLLYFHPTEIERIYEQSVFLNSHQAPPVKTGDRKV